MWVRERKRCSRSCPECLWRENVCARLILRLCRAALMMEMSACSMTDSVWTLFDPPPQCQSHCALRVKQSQRQTQKRKHDVVLTVRDHSGGCFCVKSHCFLTLIALGLLFSHQKISCHSNMLQGKLARGPNCIQFGPAESLLLTWRSQLSRHVLGITL